MNAQSKVPAEIDATLAPLPPDELTRLANYIKASVPGVEGAVSAARFTGGFSNLTYLVTIGAQEYVLKREPPGHKAKSAHDMSREFRMLAAVAPHYPLAPKPLLLCEDPTVIGGAFVLMQRIRGEIVRQNVDHIVPGALAQRLLLMIDALADLHRLDIGTLGLKENPGYTQRQIEGWIKRFAGAQTRVLPAGDAVASWLAANIPEPPRRSCVVHNDFKLDNVVWDPEAAARLVGVLDWEMATVGNPLLDLACTMSFWIEADDAAELRAVRPLPSALPGMPTRAEALTRYAARAGISTGTFTFYRCFGLFRRAVIEQQKFHRYATGQTTDPRFAQLEAAVATLLAACLEIIEART